MLCNVFQCTFQVSKVCYVNNREAFLYSVYQSDTAISRGGDILAKLYKTDNGHIKIFATATRICSKAHNGSD